MQRFPLHPSEMARSLWKNRYLFRKSVQREVIGRYRGSIFGILWSFFQPMFMLVVYTFVFSVVFKAKWGGGSGSRTEFALILFAGLLVFNPFAETVNKAPGLILNNVNYVKKVIFPLEILPWVNLGGALFNALVSFVVWLGAYLILFGPPPLSIFFLPLVVAPLFIVTGGLSFALSALGVYLRDISHIVGIVTTALLFLSGIFYSVEHLPKQYQIVLRLNPLAAVIEQARNVMLWGKVPDFGLLFLHYVCSLVILCLGFAFFQKARKGFADVI